MCVVCSRRRAGGCAGGHRGRRPVRGLTLRSIFRFLCMSCMACLQACSSPCREGVEAGRGAIVANSLLLPRPWRTLAALHPAGRGVALGDCLAAVWAGAWNARPPLAACPVRAGPRPARSPAATPPPPPAPPCGPAAACYGPAWRRPASPRASVHQTWHEIRPECGADRWQAWLGWGQPGRTAGPPAGWGRRWWASKHS